MPARAAPPNAHVALDSMRAVLAEAGGSLASLVEVTVFLTSMEDYAAFNAVGPASQAAPPPISTSPPASPSHL